MAFVGTKTLDSLAELQKFVGGIKQEQDYYFLRSPHKVSGIKSELTKEFNSANEGQVFNSQWELRWQKKGTGYNLLLLSKENTDICSQFVAVPFEWKTEDRKALLYESNEISEREIRSKETRFPKGFVHNFASKESETNKPTIGQRYFFNSQTATVHFVALTLSE